MRGLLARRKEGQYVTIPDRNHFIQVKVITLNCHLPHNALKPAKPDVDLLSSGGVEEPFIIQGHQLGEVSGVAVGLAMDIRDLVLTLEVKDIDREANSGKNVGVVNIDKVSPKLAVVVVEDMGRESRRKFGGEDSIEKVLQERCQ